MVTRKGRSGVLRTIMITVIVVIVVVGATYALPRFSSGEWSILSTPTATATFTSTPVIPTATVFVPSDTPTVTLTPTRSVAVSYMVQEGDNLHYIATEYEIEVDELVAYNLEEGIDLTTGMLLPNQEILIPPPSFEATPLEVCPTAVAPGAIIQHRIRPGDILQLLADECNTTLDAILEANETLAENPDLLGVGDVIEIPAGLLALTPPTPAPPTRRSTSASTSTPMP